jgi:hypothetical protein
MLEGVSWASADVADRRMVEARRTVRMAGDANRASASRHEEMSSPGETLFLSCDRLSA